MIVYMIRNVEGLYYRNASRRRYLSAKWTKWEKATIWQNMSNVAQALRYIDEKCFIVTFTMKEIQNEGC